MRGGRRCKNIVPLRHSICLRNIRFSHIDVVHMAWAVGYQVWEAAGYNEVKVVISYLTRSVFAVLLLVACAVSVRAQVPDRSVKVDTLSVANRLSLRTNAVDWVLLVPNIGVEFDLVNKNWSRWALGLDVRGNWQASHTFKQGVVFNVQGAKIELRNYWRPRQIDGRTVVKHTGFFDRLFSCRRDVVKRPTVVYYRGVYTSLSDFSFKFGSTGRQGTAVMLGVSWGAVRPLFTFANGNSLDLEIGVNVGACFLRWDTYRLIREDNCYRKTWSGTWKMFPIPVPSDARIGFVYRMGKYPTTSKYRWRYDCDYAFAALQDSINLARENAKINKQISDSISHLIKRDFERVYSVEAKANKIVADSLRMEAEREKKKAKAEARRAKRAAKAAADTVDTADGVEGGHKDGKEEDNESD